MAVAITGSSYTTTENTQTVDQELAITTVPSDSNVCIVALGGYIFGGLDFDQLNWNGDDADIDFTQIGTTTSAMDVSVFMMLDTHGTYPTKDQAATLYYSLDNVPTDGAHIIAFFLSGVDTASALIGNQQRNGAAADWTSPSVGVVGADDLGIIVGSDYGNAVDADPATYGQTALWESGAYDNVYLSVGYELGEDQLRIESAGNYLAGIAFAIAAAAAGGNAPTGALYGPLCGPLGGPAGN